MTVESSFNRYVCGRFTVPMIECVDHRCSALLVASSLRSRNTRPPTASTRPGPSEDVTVFRTERAAIPLMTDWPLQAEITDEEAMLEACDGIDAVVHLRVNHAVYPRLGWRPSPARLGIAAKIPRAGRRRAIFLALLASAFGTFTGG